MKKNETKQKLIEIGARIIHKKGYNNTGIQEILNEAGVPKGSFYFYFKSKEDFGLSIIEYYSSFMDQKMNSIFGDKSLKPLKRLENFLNAFMNFFKECNYELGCPVGNFSQEMGDLSDKFAAKSEEALEKMASVFKECLDEAQTNGDISKDLDTKELSDFILNSWEGALVRMKVQKSSKSLELLNKYLFNYILK